MYLINNRPISLPFVQVKENYAVVYFKDNDSDNVFSRGLISNKNKCSYYSPHVRSATY